MEQSSAPIPYLDQWCSTRLLQNPHQGSCSGCALPPQYSYAHEVLVLTKLDRSFHFIAFIVVLVPLTALGFDALRFVRQVFADALALLLLGNGCSTESVLLRCAKYRIRCALDEDIEG